MMLNNILAVVKITNSYEKDLTDIQIPIDVSEIKEKYGKVPIRIFDEYKKEIPFSYVNNKYPVKFEDWNGKKIVVKIPLLTTQSEYYLLIVKGSPNEKMLSVYDHYIPPTEEHKDIKLSLGQKLQVIDKYKFSYGHIQGISRLYDYIYISTVDKDNKKALILKTKISKDKLEVEKIIDVTYEDLYHPSGLCEDAKTGKLYVAVAQYKPDVDKASVILRVDPNTMKYEKLWEVEDHIGSICVGKKYIYLFSWDGERMYILDHNGNLVSSLLRKGWGRIQDCDYINGKIYATAQREDKIYIIDTKTFRAIDAIYTPKGFTQEGFDIDHKDPTIFWFAPDDGFIYKVKYSSVLGYSMKIYNLRNINIAIENNDITSLYIDKIIALIKSKDKEFSFKHKSDFLEVTMSSKKISIYSKDTKFRINVNELEEAEEYLVSIRKSNEEIYITKIYPKHFIDIRVIVF